ncbi:hypothetical protein INR49_009563 [Caranx melampygus]|nr:hypothetical protein INR49_009563 [Caranx melampygus]
MQSHLQRSIGCFSGMRSLRPVVGRQLPERGAVEARVSCRPAGHDPRPQPHQPRPRHAFSKLGRLVVLHLKTIGCFHGTNCFHGLHSLETLTITGARITSLPASVCEQLPNLQLLDLSYNQIQTLPSFSGCESIQKIDLHHNEIEELQENTFHGLMSLCCL